MPEKLFHVKGQAFSEYDMWVSFCDDCQNKTGLMGLAAKMQTIGHLIGLWILMSIYGPPR